MTAKVKPKMRGVSHEGGAYVAALAGIILVSMAPTTRAAWSAGVYCVSLVSLLGISAFYHRRNWKSSARAVMRRLDHSAIFVLIAGTYTPICVLVLGEGGTFSLGLAWSGAALGVAQSVFWTKLPRPFVALLCVMLGWVAVLEWTPLQNALSAQVLGLIVGGGLLYTIGAIVYSREKPDPWPTIFGYHEIFHVLVLLASLLHFTAIAQIVFEFGGAVVEPIT
jgi:hemolysin III